MVAKVLLSQNRSLNPGGSFATHRGSIQYLIMERDDFGKRVAAMTGTCWGKRVEGFVLVFLRKKTLAIG